MDKDKLKIGIDQGTRMHDDFIDAMTYCYNDILTTMKYADSVKQGNPNQLINLNLRISKVIFHDPATIIYWSDNTRTVVKCSKDDIYDPEKGMAMAICKKILGYRFKEIFKEYLPEEEIVKKENDSDIVVNAFKVMERLSFSASEAAKNLSKYSK